MTFLQAIILGIIQGITEFLPISSSGHLALGQYFFGLTNLDSFIIFDLVCHLGTLGSIFVVFSQQIGGLFSGDWTRVKQIILGTLPLFLVLPILKPIEHLYDQPHLLGFFYFTTAAILYAGIRWGYDKGKKNWKDPVLIGFFQTLALLPGVSRSGSTISAARLVGWSREEAVTFSFLLAIPAILGGTALKLLQLITSTTETAMLPASVYLAGFSTSFLFGYGALLLLIRLAVKDQFMYFVWYCLLLGAGLTAYFYM